MRLPVLGNFDQGETNVIHNAINLFCLPLLSFCCSQHPFLLTRRDLSRAVVFCFCFFVFFFFSARCLSNSFEPFDPSRINRQDSHYAIKIQTLWRVLDERSFLISFLQTGMSVPDPQKGRVLLVAEYLYN